MCHFFQTYLNSRDICLRYLTIFEEIHFLNFDKNLNPSCVMEGKKKEKNVSERVKRRLCSRWNNCTLEMMVWKGKEFEFKCYCVHTFLSAEDISLTGSHVFVFFNVHDFIFLHCIYISNLKIHYGMASCRFDNLFFCLFFLVSIVVNLNYIYMYFDLLKYAFFTN